MLSVAWTSWCQPPEEQRLSDLLEQARHADPQGWAKLLIQADAEAVKLERRQAGSCCGIRCVSISRFFPDLHYRWNEIGQSEEYQHDLLKTVIYARRGTPEGADALVVLLRSASSTLDNDWVPLFKTVIGIVGSRRWHVLKDPRLIRIEGEAYETWWSLSRANPRDPYLADNDLTPADFSEGSAQARLKAIAAFEKVLSAENDPALRRRTIELRQRHDTNQRAWFRAGD